MPRGGFKSDTSGRDKAAEKSARAGGRELPSALFFRKPSEVFSDDWLSTPVTRSGEGIERSVNSLSLLLRHNYGKGGSDAATLPQQLSCAGKT